MREEAPKSLLWIDPLLPYSVVARFRGRRAPFNPPVSLSQTRSMTTITGKSFYQLKSRSEIARSLAEAKRKADHAKASAKTLKSEMKEAKERFKDARHAAKLAKKAFKVIRSEYAYSLLPVRSRRVTYRPSKGIVVPAPASVHALKAAALAS